MQVGSLGSSLATGSLALGVSAFLLLGGRKDHCLLSQTEFSSVKKKKKKKSQQAPNGITCAKPMKPNGNLRRCLFAVSISPCPGMPSYHCLEFHGQHQCGNWAHRPFFIPQRKDEVIFLSLVLPYSAYKSLPFCIAPWSSFLSTRCDAAQFMNC